MIKVALIPNTPMKIVLEDYYFQYEGRTHKIPTWFAYDGASIPRFVNFLADRNHNDITIQGAIHDFLYSKASNLYWRYKMDRHMKENIDWFSQYPIYLWIRSLWWNSYKEDRNYHKYHKEIKEARKDLWFNLSITK